MSSQLKSRDGGLRSERRLLIVTGAVVGAAGALLLPLIWVGIWGVVGGLDGAGVGEWLVISLVYAVPAAVVFALLGLASGVVSSLIWAERRRLGTGPARVWAAVAAALIVGIPAAVGLLVLFESALAALALGAIAAIVAGFSVVVTIGRLMTRGESVVPQASLLGP